MVDPAATGRRPTDWQQLEVPHSWSDFMNMVVGTSTTGWVFRGQADSDYGLVTSLERALSDVPRGAWGDREDSAIDFFRSRALSILSETPHVDDYLGWLTFMQHYQAPTRLLDWSESPYVAAYFAYAEMRQSDPPDFVSVWALSARALRSAFARDDVAPTALEYLYRDDPRDIDYPTFDDPAYGPPWPPLARESAMHALENAFLRYCRHEQVSVPFPTRPPVFDQRMLSQRAIFTFDGTLDGGIPYPLADPFGSGLGDVVLRIDLNSSWREEALTSLAAMGLGADTLFPGMDGIGQATQVQLNVGAPTVRDVLRGRG